MKPHAKSSAPEPDPPRRKKRWRPRLLITALVLLVLGALANGPGARWFIRHTARAQLGKLGLEGDLAVEGRLSSGFTLRDGRFTGATTKARVSFDELSVQYVFTELLDRRIRGISGRNIDIVLPPSSKPKKSFAMPDLDILGGRIRTIRHLAQPVAIDLEGIRFQKLRRDAGPFEVQLAALVHPADSDGYTLDGFSCNALGPDGLPEQDIGLRWTEEEFVLNQLQVLPDLALGSTRLTYAPGAASELFTVVNTADSRLVAYADTTGRVEFDLGSAPLDISALRTRFFPDLQLGGTVTHLHFQASGLLEAPSAWRAVANLQGRGIRWKDHTLESLGLDLNLDERVLLTADLGDELDARLDLENPLLKASPKDKPDWWKGLAGNAELKVASVHGSMRRIFSILAKDLPSLRFIPDGALALQADLLTGGKYGVQVSNGTWSLHNASLNGKPLPKLQGTAALQQSAASLRLDLADPREDESLRVEASYNLDAKTYEGSLEASLPDAAWLIPFLPGDSPEWKPLGKLALTWNGSGSLPEKTHRGAAGVTDLTLRSPGEPGTTSAKLTASYNWPQSVNLPSLEIHNGDLHLDGKLAWKNQRLDIDTLRLHDATGPLLAIKGALPLDPGTLSLDAILKQNGPLDLAIEADALQLERLRALLPVTIPPALRATLTCSLKLAGTVRQPTLDGKLLGSGIILSDNPSLPPLDTEILLATNDATLLLDGKVNEPDGRVVTLAGKLPLATEAWLRDPETFRAVPLDLTANITDLTLSRLRIFNSKLADAEGVLNSELRLTGTPAQPTITGTAGIDLKNYPLPGTPYRGVRDGRIRLRLDGKRIVVEPSTALVAGGRFTLSGEVDLAGAEPALDLRLAADHALLWRNDSFILRANSALSLTGPWSAARLGGSLSLVESLYYKDIEILPVGVPTASAPRPKLPSIDKARVASSFDVPAPFNAWTLDVSLNTADPVLIRGNVATGTITADARLTGTFANPRPSGRFHIQKARAALPFSRLNIKDGYIILQPDAPLDPILDIRGTSTVNSQRVNLYLYGPLSNPKYTLSSDRGLPENEILTLLATGTTADELEDPEVAKSKAFQVFLEDLRRRANKPGGNKLFRGVLNSLNEVDLKVGENDPFSGRKFNSATLQLSDRFYLSASVDGNGNTRGLVIFSIRFR